MNWQELLKQFPALWAVVGGILGSGLASAIFVFANRKFSALVTAQTKNLTELHEKQIAAQKDLLEMQAAIASKTLLAMTAEREDYKQKLHDANDAHNLTTIELEKLKLQPDLGKLLAAESGWNDERRKVYSEFGDTLKSIRDSINSHDRDVDQKVKPLKDGMAELLKFSKIATKALQILVKRDQPAKKKKKLVVAPLA